MKKLLILILIIAVAAFAVWKIVFDKERIEDEHKTAAITVHSSAFNNSLQTALGYYTAMNDGFVNWDSSAVNTNATSFLTALDSLQTDDLKKDSSVYQTAVSYIDILKTESKSIAEEPNWKEKRGSLNIVSQNLYDLLRTVQYDLDKIYYQECPMAFGEDKYGYWVSTQRVIRNPYLGTSDPQWGRKMLSCGSTRDSLKFFDLRSKP